MSQREAELEQKFFTAVVAAGGWALKVACLSWVGLPDRMVLFRGRMWFVELKQEGRTPRATQRLAHQKLAEHGFPVAVLDTDEKCAAFIEEKLK